jgi:hypothetical protein
MFQPFSIIIRQLHHITSFLIGLFTDMDVMYLTLNFRYTSIYNI